MPGIIARLDSGKEGVHPGIGVHRPLCFPGMPPGTTEPTEPTEPEPTELHVCHRCLVRLDASAGGVDLPRRLKEALCARGLTERTRVLPSGCLGHCPKGRVSVLVLPDGGTAAHVQLIDPEKDGEDLAEHLARWPVPAAPP
ncbi:(2Fe-2S) ferredoxin domain-containing protein [Pyxidicoccus xibeiensis]|uniref:(2Fe-2S) ferredoxin domain-containing protein n=1 Tax=Pyxidicoccus xibeiensis TaxID=2906759 RepID=UPI0020A6FFB7|nr:(2Fe-2S) ferredoxin domain-containing protein [Pyxidicoccus xibeiensis]MCP3136395.1 (2Fe-2S) ferredoxin domain-containing protein [Pyxidicoccus xibeiensis]